MTDRIHGFIVTLDDDIREDDAEAILNAIRMVKRVRTVSPMVADHADWMARDRVNAEWRRRLYDMMKGDPL